jgi:recombination protein RecA
MAEAGKQKALDTALANLKKRFGDGTVMKLGEASRLKVEAIPTGSLSLDMALGIGGVPRGRITEIYGPEASGRSRSAGTSSPRPRGWVALQPSLTSSISGPGICG